MTSKAEASASSRHYGNSGGAKEEGGNLFKGFKPQALFWCLLTYTPDFFGMEDRHGIKHRRDRLTA